MAEQEDFSQLPLVDQFAHKNWKARKGGYETAAKEFQTAQPTDPLVREFTDGQLWKVAVSDSNVAAQQEALAAYRAFLEAGGVDAARRTRAHTISGVVEKGLTGRAGAKQAATETLLLLIELDKADPVLEELLPFLSHKVPKTVVAALGALKEIVRSFGCKVVEPKPVIKALPKIYGHADKNVRAEGQGLTIELYRWLREAMKPLFWNDLKEVQQKDLEKLFEPIQSEPPPKQERLLRSQQAAKEAAQEAEVGAEEAGEDEDDEGAIDLEPEYEAVDVLAKVPKDFGDRLASSKWKDRKEALDDLFAAVNVPLIQEGQFDDIIRGLAKSMKDANIMVVSIAANCVECIAKGLRKSFSKYRSTILEPMLERFKEKKQAVTDALAAACDAVFMATGLNEIEANVLEAMKNKNPQIKEHSAKFLIRSLKIVRTAPTPEQTKEMAESAKKLITESVATLRDAGAEIIGVLWKIMGDRNMLAHLEGLDDIRKSKIKEFSEAAEVKAKWKPKAAPPPKAAGKKPAPSGKKAPAGAAKKTAPPRATSPPAAGDQLQPRPTSKPVAKPGGALKAPGTGLKAPGSGLAKPGMKAPSATASPKRQSQVVEDEYTQAPPSKPNLAAPGRGLAGRPLGKPAAAPSSPPPAAREEPVSSALSSIERQELAELRQTVEILQQQTSDLRTEKMKLTSQTLELQNQNAQLIEDHTRDVLQIKAKETQLVRSRSDADAAEDRANSLSREIERLKRELNRLGRNRAGNEYPADVPTSNGDAPPSIGTPRSSFSNRNSYNVPSTRAYGVDNYGEGKENIPAVDGGEKLSGVSAVSNNSSHASRPMSNGGSSGGRATPSSVGGAAGDMDSYAGGAGGNPNRQSQDGVESWRRAAEVTQNLKARIEMMKARQNIGRGQ